MHNRYSQQIKAPLINRGTLIETLYAFIGGNLSDERFPPIDSCKNFCKSTAVNSGSVFSFAAASVNFVGQSVEVDLRICFIVFGGIFFPCFLEIVTHYHERHILMFDIVDLL